MNRAERNDDTKRRLFEAATKIVGKMGYAEASIARITEKAGVAQGTFYNHFDNRQELLDQLLPTIGLDMIQFIRAQTPHGAKASVQEILRFKSFFEFLKEVPEFLRILTEAEVYAPAGYRKHIENVSEAYLRILKRARESGQIRRYADDELEVIVHVFMGAREYLSRRYCYSNRGVKSVPDEVITAYEQLLTKGLFQPSLKGVPT